MGRYPYSFDRVAGIYDSTRALPSTTVRRFARAVVELHSPGMLLEIGVGTGRLALPLQRGGVPVVGIDVSRAMLAVGFKKGLRDTLLGDAHRLPFPAKTFSSSMSNHVLHLLKDWRRALGEICRVTQGEYFSLVEEETETPDLESAYGEAVRKGGFDRHRPGIPERKLPQQLSPSRIVDLGRRRHAEDAMPLIDLLERRTWSSLWDVPEPLHRGAIEDLRARFSGTTVRSETRFQLVVWTISRLERFLEG